MTKQPGVSAASSFCLIFFDHTYTYRHTTQMYILFVVVVVCSFAELQLDLLLAPVISYPITHQEKKTKNNNNKTKTASMQILSQCADSSTHKVLRLQFGVKCVASLGSCLL